ncbi:MAG: CsgG/HfaB family protein, partial [Burkholderiales bacterium]
WFQVIERERLDNVLRERAVIREMRSTYLGEKLVNPDALPPLLFAGILLEGGIIGYDSNTKSGGLGARFLGIGGSTQYREDTVTIYLRAVSVKTGEVLSNVSVRKSIASVSVGVNAFRFIDFKNLLESEAGFASNEPDQIALTQAIEKAVHALILEGALNNLWCLRSPPEATERMLRAYVAERDSLGSPDQALLPTRIEEQLGLGACAPSSTSSRSMPEPFKMDPSPNAAASRPARFTPSGTRIGLPVALPKALSNGSGRGK